MIYLDEFREHMKELAALDKKKKSARVTGSSLEDALKQGSLELGVPVSHLEYEVLDKGNSGVLGFGKKETILIIYEAEKKIGKNTNVQDLLSMSDSSEEEIIEEVIVKPGDFSVRLGADGAYLKVVPPRNGGIEIKRDEVIAKLHERAVHDIDIKTIENVVVNADEVYVKVGEFVYNPANDALLSVDVSDDEMKAFIYVTQPGAGGADLTATDITSFLINNGVTYGALENNLQLFEDHPVYNEPFLVSEGLTPYHGADARIIYNFDTDPSHAKLKERDDGTVDFKELNIIQNVVKGQPLAKKIPPEPGKEGRTVYGKFVPARDGRDLEIGLGKNVALSDNGNTVIADASGQVLLLKNKITVETVLVIPGDVNISTGNVNGLGTVVVKGNVEDGFIVKAQGNIEVNGYVGRASLDAGGDIVVRKGINGGDSRNAEKVTVGRTLWASFITNAHIDAGEFVIVSDGIVNSQIDCKRKVLCKGKRAKIVGGHLRAGEEINAAVLGSTGGAETILEVGYDPRTKQELDDYFEQQKSIEKELNEIDKNIQGLVTQKKVRKKKLSFEKEQLFRDLRIQHNELISQMKLIESEISKREAYLKTLKQAGKVSASHGVHSAVRIQIKDAYYEVNNPYDNPVTFLQEHGVVKTTSYEEIIDDIERRS